MPLLNAKRSISIKAGKLTRLDPSRTITLRRQFERDLGKRFNQLWQAIQTLLVEEDAFGLRSGLVIHKEEDGKWITVKGNHIFIPEGKNVGEAIKEHFGRFNKGSMKMVGAPHLPKYTPPSNEELEGRVGKLLSYSKLIASTSRVSDGGKAKRVSVSLARRLEDGTGVWIDKRGSVYLSSHGVSGDETPIKADEEMTAKVRQKVASEVLSLSEDFHQRQQKFDTTAESLAREIAGMELPVELHHPEDSNSRYIYVNMPKGGQFKIRFADHPQPKSYLGKSVGGFDTSTGERHSAADVSIDPETKETVITALRKLKLQLASSGKGQVHNARWQFHSTEQQLTVFQQWLKQQIAKHLLGEQKKEEEWLDNYIAQGFLRGAGRAFDDTRAPVRAMLEKDPNSVSDFYRGTREEFLRSSFAHPISREKVRILAARTFTDLKGVTDSMAAKVSHTLLDGLVQGDNPRVIASRLFKDINISKTRAQTIARTEIIRTHAEGQLDAFVRLGVEEVGVMAEWSTAGDNRVCKLCKPLDGTVLTVEEAKGLLPRHPNCRCAWLPANVGENIKGQKRSSSAIARAFDRSYAEETTRTKSFIEVKRTSKWAADDKTIKRNRPQSIL